MYFLDFAGGSRMHPTHVVGSAADVIAGQFFRIPFGKNDKQTL